MNPPQQASEQQASSQRAFSWRSQRPFWPQSMPGRLLVIFAIGLLLSQSLTGILYWRDRQLNATPALIKMVGHRIVAITALLESTPTGQYDLVLQALNDPLLQAKILTSPPSYPELRQSWARSQGGVRPNPIHKLQQKRLKELYTLLSQSIDAPVFVFIRPTHHHGPPPSHRKASDHHGPSPSHRKVSDTLLPSRRQLVVVIAASQREGNQRERSQNGSQDNLDNQWWVFTLPVGFGSRHHGPTFPTLLVATGLGIWLLSAWATRRITDPLLRFAAAADRLGMDVNASPLPERGSRELKQAAQAFNQMQGRLQRLISDRTLMFAAISHDLRTILTRLRLRAEFIDDPIQQQKAQDDLSQMEVMLNSTLSFAKEDSTPEERTLLDMDSLLQSICDDLADAGRSVTFVEAGVGAGAGTDRTGANIHRFSIQGQPTALRRALTNLLENAAIYGQTAQVSVQPTDDGVEIAIADQGPGIPVEQQDDIFKPFFRLERSRNRETGGTGLGLAVARTIIHRHGGDISVRNYPHPDITNQPDGGLLVTVRLPGRARLI